MTHHAELIALVAACSACTPYDPQLSSTPFLCGTTDPKCPDGYTCVTSAGKSVCTSDSPTTPTDGPPHSGNCTMPFSGVLATWSLAGATGSQTSTAAGTTAPGVTAMPLTRAPALIAATGTGSMNSTNWPLGPSLDPMSYYTISLSPPAGCNLSVSSLAADIKSSGTGPASAAAGTSVDSYTATTPVATNAPSTPALSATITSGSLEIRIFGYGAMATSGTMRVQNDLSVMGSIQ